MCNLELPRFQRPLWLRAACPRPGGVPFLGFKFSICPFSICKTRIIPKGPQGGCEASSTAHYQCPRLPCSQSSSGDILES